MIIVYPMHWIDPQISFSVGQSVRLLKDRLSNDYVHNKFFTNFHEILHAAQKCGRFVAYCLWDKPEVVYQF